MKIFIVLSIISLVSALPRPESQTDSEKGDHDLENGQVAAMPIPAENDDNVELNFENLIKAVDTIKAVLNEIHDNPENNKNDTQDLTDEKPNSQARVIENQDTSTEKQQNPNAIDIIKGILLKKYHNDEDDNNTIEVKSEKNVGGKDLAEGEEDVSTDRLQNSDDYHKYRPINGSKRPDNLPNNGSNIHTTVNGAINKSNERVRDNEIINAIANDSSQAHSPDVAVNGTVVSNNTHKEPKENTSDNESESTEKNVVLPLDKVKIENIHKFRPWFAKGDHFLPRPHHRVPDLLH